MTDPTPYTDDDVERLAEWAHLPGVTNVSEDRQVALNLLRRGVTLPPEPDTPAEAEERYYVQHNDVYDRTDHQALVRTHGLDAFSQAVRVGRLLNLDESVKDDVCSGLHEAYPALVEQLAEARQAASDRAVRVTCLAHDAVEWREKFEQAELGRDEALVQRDEARAEVERLTAELAETRKYADAAQSAVGYVDMPTEGSGMERIVAKVPVSPTDAHGFTDAEHDLLVDLIRRNPSRVRSLLTLRTQIPTPDDATGPTDEAWRLGRLRDQEEGGDPDATGRTDTATEPLFTAVVTANSGRRGDWHIAVPCGRGVGMGQEVDVYPAGVRPAAPTVTASDIAVAVETAAIAPGGTWSIPVGGFDGLADALNRLLAERLPAAADPLTWQIGQVEAWGWHPAMSAAPADCTGECGDGECNCSGEYRVLSWAPPEDRR